MNSEIFDMCNTLLQHLTVKGDLVGARLVTQLTVEVSKLLPTGTPVMIGGVSTQHTLPENVMPPPPSIPVPDHTKAQVRSGIVAGFQTAQPNYSAPYPATVGGIHTDDNLPASVVTPQNGEQQEAPSGCPYFVDINRGVRCSLENGHFGPCQQKASPGY